MAGGGDERRASGKASLCLRDGVILPSTVGWWASYGVFTRQNIHSHTRANIAVEEFVY